MLTRDKKLNKPKITLKNKRIITLDHKSKEVIIRDRRISFTEAIELFEELIDEMKE